MSNQTALQSCVDALTYLADTATAVSTDTLIGQYYAASGHFDPSTFVKYIIQSGINPAATSAFVHNAGPQMGNYALCKDMDMIAYNYDAMNFHLLKPTYCAAYSIGAVCVPSQCAAMGVTDSQFTFAELQAEVAKLVSDFDGAEFRACQGVTDTTLYAACASTNSRYLYYSNLFNFLEQFNILAGGYADVTCYPDSPIIKKNTIATIATLSIIAFLCLICSVWAALSRTPANYFRVDQSSQSTSPSLLDEPLLSPTGEKRPSLAELLGEDEYILSKPPAFVQAFDCYTNIKSIFSFKRRKGPFAAFDCLRACSAMWVILGHTLFWASFYPIQAYLITPGPGSFDSTFLGQVLFTQSFTMAVDTFFFLSAFLATYFILKESAMKPHFSFVKVWISKVINRALRILPAFAAALFFSWLVAPLFTDGPGLPPSTINAGCDDKGWLWALLFLNNIYPWDNRGSGNCFGHTWYLACDLQLFTFLPPIAMAYMKAREADVAIDSTSRRLGIFIFVILVICGSCTSTIITSLDEGFSTYYNDGELSSNYAKDYYALPWARLPAYYLGILFAIVWYEKEIMMPDFRLSFGLRNLLLSLSLIMIFVAVYGGYWGMLQPPCYIYDSSGKDCGSGIGPTSLALIAAFNRPTFVLGVAILSMICFLKQGGIIQDIMESKVWLPMSLVSYSIYLMHPTFLTLNLVEHPTMIYLTYYIYILTFLGILFIAFLGAIILNACVEVPFGVLQKKFMWK